jgi:ribosome-binding factor A
MLRLLCLVFCIPLVAVSQDLSKTAQKFITSLNAQQQKKALYTSNSEEKYNWHFFPKTDRKGISLGELDEQQKKAALELVRLCFSENGVQKVNDVMSLEGVLKSLENRGAGDGYRDAGKYYFILFGKPDEKSSWGWRLEGHHLSFSFTSKNNKLVSATPGFIGANPAIVPDGPQKGKAALREETEKGFALVNMLSKEQMTQTLISDRALPDIITFVSRRAYIEKPQGIFYSALNKEQQAKMMELVEVYIRRYTKLFADDMLSELKAAGLEKLQFAWAGSLQPGAGHYYRIQGPTIIIEYDNTQNNANHIHSVLRDLKHDFGGDEMMAHYEKDHLAGERE